jgi:GrpB-like predicted nucleotidyltransferase (UPF0157 family)
MTTIGLARGTVKIVPYQPGWRDLFLQEALLLRSVMGPAVLAIEHIGSTSLEGMPAKPIIDLMVAVPSLEESKRWIARLAALTYEWRPDTGVPDRVLFAKGPRNKRTHHLSLAEQTSHFYRDKVLFRDFLRLNQEAFEKYRLLKQQLATEHAQDRAVYTKGKEAFVGHILRLATANQ